MASVLVRGKLMHPDGNRPWANAPIEVTYYGYSQTPTTQRPSDRIQAKTALDGTWAVSLWVNAEGDYQSYYLFKFANKCDDKIKIYLPTTTPPVMEFSELAIASTPPSDPAYPSLVSLIYTMLSGGGGGSGPGYASNIAIGLPIIADLPGISDVKSALIELAKNIPVQTSFTQASLSVAGIFPYVHGRNTTTPHVEVFNEYGEIVIPDSVLIVNPDEIGILLKSFEPLPGSWRVKVSRG